MGVVGTAIVGSVSVFVLFIGFVTVVVCLIRIQRKRFTRQLETRGYTLQDYYQARINTRMAGIGHHEMEWGMRGWLRQGMIADPSSLAQVRFQHNIDAIATQRRAQQQIPLQQPQQPQPQQQYQSQPQPQYPGTGGPQQQTGAQGTNYYQYKQHQGGAQTGQQFIQHPGVTTTPQQQYHHPPGAVGMGGQTGSQGSQFYNNDGRGIAMTGSNMNPPGMGLPPINNPAYTPDHHGNNAGYPPADQHGGNSNSTAGGFTIPMPTAPPTYEQVTSVGGDVHM